MVVKKDESGTVTVSVSGKDKKKQQETAKEEKAIAKEKEAAQVAEQLESVDIAVERIDTGDRVTDAQIIGEWENWLSSVRACSGAVRAASESLQKVDDGRVGKLVKMFESMSRKEAENLKRDVEQLKSKIRRLL